MKLHRFYNTDGFTLAEVLITLAIIGIVAAIIIPALIHTNKKRVIETKLLNIYSIMNQAVKLSELEYGSYDLWDFTCLDDETETYKDKCFAVFQKYFIPHMRLQKTEVIDGMADTYNLAMYLNDGSLLIGKMNTKNSTNTGIDFFFYPHAYNYTSSGFSSRDDLGTSMFAFELVKSTLSNNNYKFVRGKGFTPYAYALPEYTKEAILTGTSAGSIKYGCGNESLNQYCTLLIQMNNWKIPDDYPVKF